jgi:hypothetical protein
VCFDQWFPEPARSLAEQGLRLVHGLRRSDGRGGDRRGHRGNQVAHRAGGQPRGPGRRGRRSRGATRSPTASRSSPSTGPGPRAGSPSGVRPS